ncbi:non-contractile tail sheath protein [Acinetobacter baumannii]
MSFAITNYGNGFEASFKSRMTNDLVGISWDSYDTKDHKLLAYETKYSYAGVVWDFDIELSASMPVLNNPSLTPTLTVYYHDIRFSSSSCFSDTNSRFRLSGK